MGSIRFVTFRKIWKHFTFRIARSTCTRAWEIILNRSSSSGLNLFLSPRKGGCSTLIPSASTRSCTVNPRSTSSKSPGSKNLLIPLFSNSARSLIEPSCPELMNPTDPREVVPMRYTIVLSLL